MIMLKILARKVIAQIRPTPQFENEPDYQIAHAVRARIPTEICAFSMQDGCYKLETS